MDKLEQRTIELAEQVLIENGISPNRVKPVLQKIGYILLDEELYPYRRNTICKSIMRPNEEKTNSLEIVCRGCTMFGRERIWHGYCGSIWDHHNWEINNSYLTFEEEPNNKYDKNAVKVVCRGEFFGTIGYVGREFTKQVKRILHNCERYRVEMKDKEGIGKEIRLIVYWKDFDNLEEE